MTGPRKHPCYPGTDDPVLIGDTAHDGRSGRSGVVRAISSFDHVGLDIGSGGVVLVPVKWLRIGPAPEPDTSPLLAIRPNRDDLRDLVRYASAWGADLNVGPMTRLALTAVDAIPADELAAIRAEIEAGL